MGPKEGDSLFLIPYRTKEKGTLPIEVVRNFTVITES